MIVLVREELDVRTDVALDRVEDRWMGPGFPVYGIALDDFRKATHHLRPAIVLVFPNNGLDHLGDVV